MNFAKSDSEFLCRHQSLVFNENLERGTASERADVLRNVIAHLTSSVKVSGQMEDEDIGALTQEYTDMYADVVDSFDEQTGLNNYAEGALALCSGNKNESQKWKSSLTADVILGMPCMQKLVKHVQISKENLLPQQKKNDLLPSNLKENELLTKTQQTTNNKQPSNLQTIQTRQTNINRNENLNQPRDRVINLYGNQSKLNSCSLPSYQENVTQKGHHPQGYVQDNCNDQQANRKPLFSSGAKNIPFEQYGSSSNVPVENKQRQVQDRKRFHNERDDEQASTDDRPNTATNEFKTARQQLNIDNQRKYGGGATQNRGPVNTAAYGTGKKSLGTRRGLNSKFVPPVMNRDDEEQGNQAANTITRAVLKTGGSDGGSIAGKYEGLDEDKLKGIEPKMVELIMNEIMDNGLQLTWDDVAGLEFAKKTIKEIVVWPMLRPDIFTGLRGPPKGLLLFGPPGTGKTLIGKCIASQSKSTFFCISASSLTSKWVGEGEKMVRALFAVARSQQPAVVFIDEIDSLLTQRTDGENEASRRIKTEFLVQLDGASTSSEDRLLMIGATNRPQEIDEAARRRFVKRLYIPLPECAARKTIITNLLKHQSYQMGEEELDMICTKTDGFSGADMATLCREAALGPIRDMSFSDIEHIAADQVRPITFCDFKDALDHVRPSVSERDLDMYLDWNKTFGSGSR